MKRLIHPFAAILASVLVRAAPAWAQEGAVAMPPQPAPQSPLVTEVGPPAAEIPPGTVISTTEESSPDYGLIGGGVTLLTGSYLASVVVGSVSSHPGDGHLFIPFVGPWVDLADRSCVPGISCGNSESGNKALLVLDGMAQDVGALAIVAGLVFPEHRVVTRIARVRVTPLLGRGTCGVVAAGAF